jgi:D-serine deaminase-like pyridoxal phosphate-dependent protein
MTLATVVGELETPILIVDLDRVERNIFSMQSYCSEHGIAFRPHIKTHKLPQIARMQVDAGAIGITCQKLGEAEVMADAAFDDIMVSFPIVGAAKAMRLVELAAKLRMSVVGDSAQAAKGLSDTLAGQGVSVDFLVECDTGYGRTGVQSPQEAAELAERVHSLPGLRFAGLMTYPSLAPSGPWLREARMRVEERALDVPTVSGGGTPRARYTHELGVITELRAGTYVYGDRTCVALGCMTLDDCAAHVLATVVSRPTPDRAILDTGSKALTSDPVPTDTVSGFGYLLEHPEAFVYALNEEHGYVDVSRCDPKPQIGDVVRVLPNHVCVVVNLYDEVVIHRSGEFLDTWPVAARGMLR